MEKIYLDAKEYDAVIDAYKNQHGYDDMSDEEKEAFDDRLDKVVAKRDEETDSSKMPNPQTHPAISITVLIQTNSEMISSVNMDMKICLMIKNGHLMKG